MRAVAYCRVSTMKGEQLDSLESQRNYFVDYSSKNGFKLIDVYADEGKSGTRMKNRTQLLKLMADAENDVFDVVLIKDVSRLARNTVDFLTTLRRLQDLKIKVIFVNYDNIGDSPFMITVFGAIAEQESANTSKRIKFGKQQNASKGKVPNIIFGYDKQIGDYFNLTINEYEADIVRRIFNMYVDDNYGTNKISLLLNKEGLKTKRNYKWSQNAILRILTNKIYIGELINGKEEVENFLTGKRVKKSDDSFIITKKPELAIINPQIFYEAQSILLKRKDAFHKTGERKIDKYPFSKLIKCTCCGYSFRRFERKYVNTYVSWICSGRNINGADSCPNKTKIDENELLNEIRHYLINLFKNRTTYIETTVNKFIKQYKSLDENRKSENEIQAMLVKLKNRRESYIEMRADGDISKEEFRKKKQGIEEEIQKQEYELNLVKQNINKSDLLANRLKTLFNDMEEILTVNHLTHELLDKLIEKIEVDERGNIGVHLRLIDDLGLNDVVLINDNNT